MTKIIDMTKYLGILLCANIHNSVRCIPSLVTPFHVEDDGYTKFYWGSGPSRMGAYFVDSKNPESMQASILHVYGKIKEINWEEVDMHFLNTWYTAKPIPLSELTKDDCYGWIAPNGDLYYAQYSDHDTVAKTIVATIYKKSMSSYNAREFLLGSWLALYDDMVTGRMNNYDITAQQHKTVERIQELTGIHFYERNIIEE